MYGIKINIKSKKGKIAIKKLKATALALVVNAPCIIPRIYISNKSKIERPVNPGSLIDFKKSKHHLIIGILMNLFFSD